MKCPYFDCEVESANCDYCSVICRHNRFQMVQSISDTKLHAIEMEYPMTPEEAQSFNPI